MPPVAWRATELIKLVEPYVRPAKAALVATSLEQEVRNIFTPGTDYNVQLIWLLTLSLAVRAADSECVRAGAV